jgi:hypothetical protein
LGNLFPNIFIQKVIITGLKDFKKAEKIERLIEVIEKIIIFFGSVRKDILIPQLRYLRQRL